MPTPDRTQTGADSAPGGTPPVTDTASFHDPAAPYPFLAPPQAADEVGRLGKYRVLGVLGKGGMGAVFRAEEPALRRLVALKVMLPQFAGNELAKSRFLREARAAAAVEHDHILPILTVDEDRGVPFIAMPLLKGMPLSDALKAARPPLSEALRVGREMAEGLAAAHERGLVHRDIKPANVWLEGNRRRVKILDFGLARAAEGGGDSPDDPATESGAVIGTPAYMSLEQANGRPVDARTDLWSLGVVLYEMATGTRPFTGPTTMAILSALALHTPPPADAVAPGCPPDLARLIAALLEKDPDRRPGNAVWVAGELARIEQSLSVGMAQPAPLAEAADDPWAGLAVTDPGMTAAPVALATAAGSPAGIAPPRRKPPLAWAVAGAAVLAAAGVGAVLVLKGRTPTDDTAAGTQPVTPTTRATAARGTDRGTKNPDSAPVGAPGLEFDGRSSHVQLPYSYDGTHALTVEAWARPRSVTTNAQNVFADGTRYFGPLDGKWGIAIHHCPDGFQHDSQVPLTAGRDAHLALVLDGKTAVFFVDGQERLRRQVRTAAPSAHPFLLGAMRAGADGVGAGFTGSVREVRISKISRYTGPFTPAPRLDTDKGTVALYHCDEGKGDVLRDSSGNNHHGKIFGAKWLQADGANVPPAAPTDPTFFNGKDLTGWAVPATGVWRVENGELVGTFPPAKGRQQSWLASARRYSDFELSFQVWVWGAGQCDLGFRGETGVGPYCSLSEGGVGRLSQGVVATPRAEAARAVRAGEFNDVAVRCRGGEVTVRVNGVVAVDGAFDLPPDGVIQWHIDDAEDPPAPGPATRLRVRNIRFVDLSKPAAVVPDPAFFNGKDLAGWAYNPKVWGVENGELVGRQGGTPEYTGIWGTRPVRDFELTFQAQSRAAVPGAADAHSFLNFRRVPGNDGRGLSLELTPRGVGKLRVKNGGNWADLADPAGVPAPAKPDDYIAVGVKAVGPRVTVTVNGQVVSDKEYPAIPADGTFAWFIEPNCTELRVRNIRFTDLAKPADPPK